MATREQIAANRANARKSTGPKTEQGKARSRANALKHGMTGAGIVLPEEDRERWEFRAETWAEEMGASGEMDRFLAGRAAMASIRLDRCVRQETADLQDRHSHALRHWQAERDSRAQVEAHAQLLPTDPAAALSGLTRSVLGCDWLRGRWEDLTRAIAGRGYWDEGQVREVVALLGHRDAPTRSSDPSAARAWSANLAMSAYEGGAVALEEWERFFEVDNPEGDRDDRIKSAIAMLMEPEAAFAILSGLCDAERARLAAVRDALWDAVDGPSRQHTLDRIAIDTTDRGMLRRRYETAATSDLHRSINQVHTNRRAAERATDADAEDSGGPCSPGSEHDEGVPPQAHEDVSMPPETVSDPVCKNEPNRPEVVASEAVSAQFDATTSDLPGLPTSPTLVATASDAPQGPSDVGLGLGLAPA